MKILILLFVLFLVSCATVSPPPQAPEPTFSSFEPTPLSWETDHPERQPWTEFINQLLDAHFSVLDTATDTKFFCPKYSSLSKDEKINMWGELFSSIALYESSWRPDVAVVGIGEQNDKNTWSVGLMQVGVEDQANYGLPTNFTFEDLRTFQPNLQLAVSIMSVQIAKVGHVLVPVGGKYLYWATIHPGGKFDQSAAIAGRVKKLKFCQ